MLRFLFWSALALAPAQAADQNSSHFAAIRRLEATEKTSPRDPEIQNELALNFFLLGQRDLARGALAKALELDPNSAQAYYLSGRFALEADQNPKAAMRAFQKALELAPDSFKSHYYLGICLRQLTRLDAAREEFRKATQSANYSWPFRALAETELDLNHASAALAPALKATELEPKSAENYLVAGKVYQSLQQPEKAVEMWQQAARLDPQWEKPHFLLGNLYLTRPETRAQANRELEQFHQLESRKRSARGGPPAAQATPQARSRAELDAFGALVEASGSLAAIRAAEGFLSRFPDSEFREKALEAELAAFHERNDPAAKTVAKSILALNPANAAAREELARVSDPAAGFTRARTFEKENRLPEAALEYERVVRENPNLAEAFHNLGLVYYRLGDYRKSADRLRSALRLKPDLTASHLFLGLAQFRLGDFQSSAAQLEIARAADPHNREIQLFLLRDFIALGRFSAETARRTLDEFPRDLEIHYTIGMACLERIREIARTANESGPQSGAFLWLSLRRAEERQQAASVQKYRTLAAGTPEPPLIREYDSLAGLLKRSFDAVLAQAPDSAAGHSIRGYLHESRNEIEEALAEYRQADDHFAAGRLLAQNVRLKEAEAEFLAALLADPQNDRAKADLGRLYLQQDQTEKAIALLREIVARYPRDAYAWGDLGKAQSKLGARSDAIQSLRKALELDPSLNQIHYQLATLYRLQGNEQLAQEELQKFRSNRKSNP